MLELDELLFEKNPLLPPTLNEPSPQPDKKIAMNRSSAFLNTVVSNTNFLTFL